MSFDTTNQGILDQLSNIQKNIHSTYMTYYEKLQQSKKKGVDTINQRMLDTMKVLETKVKWGTTIMEKKIHDLMQKTVTTLETKVQTSESAVSTIVGNVSTELEGMEVSAREKCKKYEQITKENCQKDINQQKGKVISDIQQCFKQCDTKIQMKITNVENTYQSYQSKVEDLVDTNI